MRSPGPARRSGLRRAGGILLIVLVVLFLGSVTGVLPVQLMRVSTGSMTPTIQPGDLLLVKHGAGDPGRRDVVVFPDPAGGDPLVKRVVAVGGDQVGIEDGVLVVNGTPVCETAIDPDRLDGVFFGPVAVPPGRLFVLGDNREESIDSRDFGTIAAADLQGAVLDRAWPSPGALSHQLC